MSAPAPFAKVEGCDLCRTKKITPWYHEDDICWVAECDVCDTPMVGWHWHGEAPPAEHGARMCARLKEVALTHFEKRWVDDHMRNVPDHWRAHARPADGFWGWQFRQRLPGALSRATGPSGAGRAGRAARRPAC